MSRWSRLTNVFRPEKVTRDLDDELQFHLEERVRELVAGGMTLEAAEKEAARRLGSALRLREQSRDVKLAPWLDSIVRDLRLGLRVLRKNATVTTSAVLSLGLALGACIAAWALVDALVLRPLPVRDPDELVYLSFPTYEPERPVSETFSDPLFVRLRESGRDRVDLFAMSTQVMRPAIFATGGEKEPVRTQFVSGDAFDRLGIRPAVGRLIMPADDVPAGGAVAVLSHAFWRRRFAGDASVVGRVFTVDGRQVQIVGVVDPQFAGVEPGRPTDVWFPYGSYNARAFGNAAFNWFRILGRVRRDATPATVQSVLQVAFTGFRRERGAMLGSGRTAEEVARFVSAPLDVRSAANGPSPLRREFARPLWILAAIAGLVLLIAGANVANLFLARAAAREREMALRLSIGASRARLIQQVLIESAIVAGLACALGMLWAGLAASSVVDMLGSTGDPVQLDLRFDWKLGAVAAALTLVTTALFGLAPAFRASRVSPMTSLKAGDHRTGARGRVMRPFVVLQVAFGLVVLFVGGLLVLSFARLSSVNPGFASADVVLINVETVQRMDPNQQRAALFSVLDRLRVVPGVRSAAAAEYNALGRAWTQFFQVPGAVHDQIEATIAPVTHAFFETMDIPVVEGRAFLPADMDRARSRAILVNRTLAGRYFGTDRAVGRLLDVPSEHEGGPREIIGVVADTRYDLRQPAAPTVYIPLRTGGTIHVRAAGDPGALTSRLRDEIRAAESRFRVTSITSQSAVIDQTLLRERLLAVLSSFFAGVGLVLVAVGLYGVLSYSVVHRTREIGIRVALGARQGGVMRMVLSDVAGAVAIGAICGLAGALYASRFVEALLFEVTARDIPSLAWPLAALVIALSLAAALPAFRATRVDPVVALRDE